MRTDILATAAALTAIIGFTVPAKADIVSNPTKITISQELVASSSLSLLNNLGENDTALELKFINYNPYIFGNTDGVVMLSQQPSIGCLVGDRTEHAADGSVMCGVIDPD